MPDLLDELKGVLEQWQAVARVSEQRIRDERNVCIAALESVIARHESRGKVVAELGPYAEDVHGLTVDRRGIPFQSSDVTLAIGSGRWHKVVVIALPEGSDG